MTGSFDPGAVVVLGRREEAHCQFGLDPEDTTISRRAVTLYFDHLWWIVNTSSHQRVRVAGGPGEGETLTFNERRALDRGALTIVIYGASRSHRVAVSARPPALQPLVLPEPTDPRGTLTGLTEVTEAERDALVAVLHEYLDGPPDREPRPLSYADAGALLGVAESAVRKRMERVVDKLRVAGVPGLEGDDLKRATARFLIINRVMSADDLCRLRRTRPEPDRLR